MSRPVLVVEDDPVLQAVVQDILEFNGYAVLQASNGKEALSLLRSLSDDALPQCIVLDLMMPIMDGRSFLLAMKGQEKEALKKIPVVIWTGMAPEGVKKLDLPPEVELVPKLMDLDQIVRIVEKTCGKSVS